MTPYIKSKVNSYFSISRQSLNKGAKVPENKEEELAT
jgi:hypothetical protein